MSTLNLNLITQKSQILTENLSLQRFSPTFLICQGALDLDSILISNLHLSYMLIHTGRELLLYNKVATKFYSYYTLNFLHMIIRQAKEM